MNTVHYLDDDNNIVPEENATQIIAQKRDENGMLIEEVFCSTKQQRAEFKKQNVFPRKISKEMQDILYNYTDKDGNYMFRKK